MHFTNGLGADYTPVSVWPINNGIMKTIIRIRCFISHRLFWWINLLGVDGAYIRSHFYSPYRCSLTYQSLMSIFIFRYLPFPSAFHASVSSDAVDVRLITIGSYSRNSTDIALDFVKAHASVYGIIAPRFLVQVALLPSSILPSPSTFDLLALYPFPNASFRSSYDALNNLARGKHSVNYKTLKYFSVDLRLGMRIMGMWLSDTYLSFLMG